MKKLLVILLLFTGIMRAGTLVVDNTPECSWWSFFGYCIGTWQDCEGGTNYKTTIQDAINAASDGDTIKICKGNYNEQVTLLKDNITITSGVDVTTPTDVNWYYNGDVLKIGDSSHKVKNLFVENISIHSFSSSSNYKAIHINYAKTKITFQNIAIKTEGADAIYGEWGVDKNTDGIFKNLMIWSKGNGIYLNQGDIQSFEDISINLLGNNGNFNGIYLGTGVKDKNHIFKHLSFDLKAEPAIVLSSGKSMVFEDINITATNYNNNTKTIYTDYSTDGNGDLSFKDINISVNEGTGIHISKTKNIDARNITITGTTNIGAFVTDTQVSGDLTFENIYFDVKADHGLQIKRGKNLSIHNATIKGSSGNGWAIRTDWNVVGNYDFKDINITAHAGGVYIAKGNKVILNNVKVSSDSTSATIPGIKFEWDGFDNMNITNSEINATGIALWINGSDDLFVDSCKVITRGDKALYISTNVDKAHIQNSCFYNESNSGNSYAIYSNNYKTNIHFNNNCLYAPNGGNYALDQKAHDWYGNYWDGVTDSNGDGKISNADTNKISVNIVDNSPLSSCPNSCGGGTQSQITLIAEYRMDECKWSGAAGEVNDSSGNGYNGKAQIADTTPVFLCKGGDFTHISQNNSDDNDDDLVKIPKETLNGLHDFTFTTWIKIDQSGNFTLLSAARASGTKNEVWIYFNSGSKFYPWIKGKRNGTLTLSQSLNDNNWHHIAVTRKDNGSSSEVCIVVDGDAADKKCKNINSSGGALIVDGVVLAQDQDSLLGGYESEQEFNGYMDEVKIFDGILSDTQINYIYNNEKNGKNWDNTNRTCPTCQLPTPVIEYRMDECQWDSDDSTYEVKNYGLLGNDANASAKYEANTISNSAIGGGICKAGNATGSRHLVPQSSIHLGNAYTISLWIKFPLDGKSHKNDRVMYAPQLSYDTIFTHANNQYYNIADRYGKNASFVFFDKNANTGDWKWCVDDANGWPHCHSFTMPNGWKHVVFTNDGSQTKLYIDGNLDSTIDYALNNIDLNRILSSDYWDDGDSTTIGAMVDEYKIFDEALSQSDIEKIYQREKAKRNWDDTNRTCPNCCGEYSGLVTPIEFEGGEVTLPTTGSNSTWTHVDFNKTFSSTPVVFMVIDNQGSNPASVRIKNVSTTGFDAMLVEPPGEDGPHLSQTLNYFAINKGVHKIGGHLIEVGSVDTKKVQGKYALNGNVKGWEELNLSVNFCHPAVIANIQTVNNLDSNIPTQPLVPWATAGVENNSSGVFVTLDMSETDNGTFDKSETIGYMVAQGNIQGSFVDDYGNTIEFETILTDPYFVGWDDSCKKVSFVNSYSKKPLIAGWKDSRIEGDGGWFRKCFHSKSQIGFVVDEDRDHDSERHHTAEKGAIFAFSDNFHLDQGPVAEYKMDECLWNGTTGEVKDSSGNGLDATAKNGATTESNTTLEGMLCHVGVFDGEDDAVRFDANSKTTLQNQLTYMAWIKWQDSNNSANSLENIFTNQSWANALRITTKNHWHGGNEVLFQLNIGGSVQYLYSNTKINDNEWHHIVATYDGSAMRLYIDGVEDANLSISGTVTTDTNDNVIGAEYGGYYFKGYIDELKVFDYALDSSLVEWTYQNEKERKNWDGSKRECPCCPSDGYSGLVTPIEFEGGEVTLKNTYNDPTWTHVDFNKTFSSTPVVFMVIDTKGGHPASVRVKNITTTGFDATLVEPQGMDGPHVDQTLSYLAVNKGVHKVGGHFIEVGTIDTKKVQGRLLNPSQNDIGWEKINLQVPFCNPAIVANIQSLNNEQGNIPKKTSKPWMTAAVEVNNSGVYLSLDASETTNGYPLTQHETIAYMVAQANIQGTFVDDYNQTIDFETILTDPYFVGWDDSCKKVSFVSSYAKKPLIAGWKDSRRGGDGGWFRKCYHDASQIGFVVDEDTANDSERSHTQEKGAVFAFSNNFHLSQEQNETIKNYRFDVWDTFRSINDRNISTKIVNKPFTLTIASLDENGLDYQEFNGTVCVKIDNDIQKTLFQNEREKNLSFEITRAIKDIRVDIKWKKNVDENCPLSNEDNSTLSTDHFAIRPEKFEIVPLPPFYAGDDFNISFYAKDYNSSHNTTDYNESYNVSFMVEANETKDGCKNGSLTLDDFNFSNGQAENIKASYDEIGDINISIKEINGSEFAQVDRDDTPDFIRLVTPNVTTIHILPYEANVTDVSFETSIGKEWLYMVKDSNISEMNVTVGATVEVFSKNGDNLVDFNSSCYGEDVKVQFFYDVNNTDEENNITLVSIGSISDNGTLADINKSVNFEKSLFSNGKATKTYAFDINRSFYKPLSPVHIQLENVTIENSVAKELYDANQTGKIKPEQNAIFYYARVYAEDLTTSKSPDTTKTYILVYDDKHTSYTKDFNQTLLHWYMNSWHDDENAGRIKEWNATKGVILDQEKADVDVEPSLQNGFWKIEITYKSDDVAFIHIDISPWLWYNLHSDGDYLYEKNSSCLHHPCIEYRFLKDTTGTVQSGNVSGVKFDLNVSRSKRGVKIFR